MTNFVVIVAGGSGQRMQSKIPKQFMILNSKPILMHTISAFYNFDPLIKILVVLPEIQINFWSKLCKKKNFKIIHTIVAGGNERFFSVKNGLDHIHENGLVAIHDGVRPFVHCQTIHTCFETASVYGNAIPAIDVTESVRIVDNDSNVAFDRTKLRIIQTPQVFKTELIKKAYMQKFDARFTDDASVLEAIGEKITLVAGNKNNIKITTPEDFKLAKILLKIK